MEQLQSRVTAWDRASTRWPLAQWLLQSRPSLLSSEVTAIVAYVDNLLAFLCSSDTYVSLNNTLNSLK